VDSRFIVLAALQGLADEGKIGRDQVHKAIEELGVNPDKMSPLNV
jgi:pyruvate dehydrogenase E1 component